VREPRAAHSDAEGRRRRRAGKYRWQGQAGVKLGRLAQSGRALGPVHAKIESVPLYAAVEESCKYRWLRARDLNHLPSMWESSSSAKQGFPFEPSGRKDSACSIRVSTSAFVRVERIVKNRESSKFFVFNGWKRCESHPRRIAEQAPRYAAWMSQLRKSSSVVSQFFQVHSGHMGDSSFRAHR
jgi:hypothetical protein